MAKKRILVIGATGMAGHMVYFYLRDARHYEMHNLVFRNKLTEDGIVCDVRDQSRLREIIHNIKPHVIINCVGALIRESRTNPENAIYLNACLPHYLKRLSDEVNGKLIHISTDCVFSGKKGNYAEDDFRDADDVYGRSKALGEIINEKDCTLRTSIIGPELKENGEGLFHWFMHQNGTFKGYTNAVWGGVTTLELAKAVERVIEDDLAGLFQVTNGLGISKFELLNLFLKTWGRHNLIIEPFENYFADKSLHKSQKYDFNVPGYEIMLKEMKDKMKEINMYPFYS